MEPLSNSIETALRLRLISATMPVLNVLLKDGLVVSGEVLESSTGIAYLSLGGRRVPAETAVELRPGQKFTARVEKSGESFVLRIIDDAPASERNLVAALRTVLAEDRPVGALVSRLVAELVEHADTLDPRERERVLVLVLAKEIERSVLQPRRGTSADDPAPVIALKTALVKSGLFHEALLARGSDAEIALARADLKSVLMTALQFAPAGPERESLQRALAGIEAEQLLDVARSQTGDARQIGVAVPDGAQLATASFSVYSSRAFARHPTEGDSDEQREADAPGEEQVNVDLAVSFSHLGPVRAEFRLDGARLGVRFVVASPEVAARLTDDADELAAGIGANGASPTLQVVTAPPESFESDVALECVSFLRDHLLLDRFG